MAELLSVVPAPSPTNKGDFQASSFWWWGVATLTATSHESRVGLNGKEQPEGAETPYGSFLAR